MKPKVAVIGLKGLPAYVGAGTVGENIIEQLKDEYDFYVYATSSHTNLKSGNFNGYYQKVFKALPLKKINIFWYYLISALHARYKGNFDLIHVHNSFAGFIIHILNGKYPTVLTTHGAFIVREKWKRYSWFFEYNTNKLVRKADYLCCVSKDEKREFKKLLNIDAHYIPNGINPISKGNLPLLDKTEPYIFFGSGRIIPTKGLHNLIQALHTINYKGKLIVAGDLDQMQTYKSEILGMMGKLHIEFVGLIKEKNLLFSYITNSELLIFPSHTEAMSMMLLEAVALDTPIVCSDITANKDILHEEDALFFRTNDDKDLAQKITWALSNMETMQAQAKIAKKRFLQEFSWKTIGNQYDRVFSKVLFDKRNKRIKPMVVDKA